MPRLKIDAKEVVVDEGLTVLQAAQKLGIEIPTLCYSAALGAYGACRVCMVEVRAHGKSRLTTACTYPAAEGIEVTTDTERAKRARKFSIELLLARCPGAREVQELAQSLGVQSPRFKAENPEEKCILCAMCVRACANVIGKSAISFAHRGAERKVQTPFDSHSLDCIGCGACAFVCPTGAIKMEDVEKVRKMHGNTELELADCKSCGRPFAATAELQHIKEKIKITEETLENCPVCRREILKQKVCKSKNE